MTCTTARDTLLDARLPIDADDGSDLAVHLRSCDACSRLATMLTEQMATLDLAVRRRAARRRRIGAVATVSTIAATAAFIAIARLDNRATKSRSTVNASSAGIVSVHVPRGKTAMVLQTKDPNVTIVWLTDAPRSGS